MTATRAKPLCECHGVEMGWHKESRIRAGGYWLCVTRRREQGRESMRQRAAKFRAQGLTAHGTRILQRGKVFLREVGYDAAHQRHAKILAGSPCARLDDTCSGRIEVALRHDVEPSHLLGGVGTYSGKHFSLDARDYLPLCASHHRRWDRGFDWMSLLGARA